MSQPGKIHGADPKSAASEPQRPRASGQEAVSNSVEPNANVTHSVFARLRGGSGASPVTGRVGGDFGRRPSAGASARYCTGYLGDIGVPVDPNPMDFSGWYEVFLDGRWFTMDARHNHPRIGRIVIAKGRDAADVAISTAFGTAQLVRFNVITEEIKEVTRDAQFKQAA